MKLKIKSLEGKEQGDVELNDEIFGLEPREDILQRVVRWQLAKRRAGTHDVKNRAEIARTGKKLYKQKGTGGARHSSARANLFRGGGRSFGPTPRDHSHYLNK
jgi:large subunit ribosomal protein L4